MSEGAAFHRILREVDRVVTALDGLTPAQLDWTPGAKGANSVLVLAAHTVGAAERHVILNVMGEKPSSTRDAEFASTGDAGPVRVRWAALRPRIAAVLDAISPERLNETLQGPVGGGTVRGMLIHAVAHAAEHAGQAELTRDMAKVAKP